MTNEEGEGRIDKILDMKASTKGYGTGRECRTNRNERLTCLTRQESKDTRLTRGKMAAHRIKSIERKTQKQ